MAWLAMTRIPNASTLAGTVGDASQVESELQFLMGALAGAEAEGS